MISDLLIGLYSVTKSVMKCGSGIFSSFPVNPEVRQECFLASSLFNTGMESLFPILFIKFDEEPCM